MRSRSEISRERRKAARKFQSTLFKKVRASQSRLWTKISDVIFGLKMSDGLIDRSVANVSRSSTIFDIYDNHIRTDLNAIGLFVGKSVVRILNLDKLYFKSFNKFNFERVNKKASRQILAGLGYNSKTNRLIRNGWLAKLITDETVARNLFRRIDQAIKNKSPLEQFRRQLRGDFLSESGPGMLEKHFITNTFDIFQQQDRQISQIYADELELNWAIYSGTAKDNTRPFCRARINNLYTREEIDRWNGLDWQGKIEGADVKQVLGGFNCRHGLDWISEELAEVLAKRKGINKFNG